MQPLQTTSYPTGCCESGPQSSGAAPTTSSSAACNCSEAQDTKRKRIFYDTSVIFQLLLSAACWAMTFCSAVEIHSELFCNTINLCSGWVQKTKVGTICHFLWCTFSTWLNWGDSFNVLLFYLFLYSSSFHL